MSHRVVALVASPQGIFELACAREVFARSPHYTFDVCTETPGPVATRDGFALLIDADLAALTGADTVIVPGWHREADPSPAIVDALLRAHDRGARLATICAGAFALAATGLLDGRTATTHWASANDLAERFPKVTVDPDVLYVAEDDIATSAGAGAGIDLCLHLLRADFGAAHAAEVARGLVMPPHREGGQAQFIAPASAPPPLDHSLGGLLDWVGERLGESVTVEDMAAHLRVSERTLARRFADQLGTSPGQWLLGRRVNAARALLEQTDLTVDAIALRVGLASATNLRRRFHRAMHTTPAAYRRSFRPAAPVHGNLE
ncbi:MAG TPA: helix-turn-helix domain-containing protein [Pseudonocardiaceae bacterium]|jgi:AraC family transcriptional activator FtrA|nr:helix-turn-helix domain-containing protein [Pseudonocardiaceae bacterium]